jgi:hypothetical protein
MCLVALLFGRAMVADRATDRRTEKCVMTSDHGQLRLQRPPQKDTLAFAQQGPGPSRAETTLV